MTKVDYEIVGEEEVRTLPIIEPVNYTMNVEVKKTKTKTKTKKPVELVIVEENDYMTGYVSFENSFPKEQDFRIWDIKTHSCVHQSLSKYFSKKKKAVIVKSPVTKKTCNMCLDEKEYTQYDESLRCSQCNDGFICHDCVYVYCGILPIYKTDDWFNDFKINCPVCRKVHYVSI